MSCTYFRLSSVILSVRWEREGMRVGGRGMNEGSGINEEGDGSGEGGWMKSGRGMRVGGRGTE